MSGGSYDYAYQKLNDFIDRLESNLDLVNKEPFCDIVKNGREYIDYDLESKECKRQYYLDIKNSTPQKFALREAFAKHLIDVSEAMKAIEWEDSGDGCDEEVQLLKKALNFKENK